MGMKKYDIDINGITHRVYLSDEAAQKDGLTPVDEPAAKAKAPANKSRTATDTK